MHQSSIKCDLHSFSTRAFWSGLKNIHIILDASPYPWVFIVNWNICLKSSNTLNFDDTDVGNSVISFSIKIIPMNKQVGAWHHSDPGSKERIGFSLFMISFCDGWQKGLGSSSTFQRYLSVKTFTSRDISRHDCVTSTQKCEQVGLEWNEHWKKQQHQFTSKLQEYELFEKHSEEEKQGDFGKHTVLILPKCFHKKTRTTLRKLIPNLHM